jgi:hypothetical protein
MITRRSRKRFGSTWNRASRNISRRGCHRGNPQIRLWNNSATFAESSSSVARKPVQDRFFCIEAASPAVNISAKVRAEGVTKAVVEVQFLDESEKFLGKKWVSYIGVENAGDKPVTHDWKEYGDSVEIPPSTKKLLIGLQIYGPGQVWFDDVKVTTGDASAPATGTSDTTIIKVNEATTQYLYESPPRPNASGSGLLIVLPRGDGSAEFQSFVREIHKQTVGEEFALAQPIATKWSTGQEIVWPTKTNKVDGMKYSTEAFIGGVITDVAKKTKLDPERILVLAWSSSGPAAYATMLQDETPVSGSLIAMSVFKPNTLTALGPP